jgi:hypothetical protein
MRFPTLAGADLSFDRSGAGLRTPQQHYSEQLLIARLQEERHEHMARIRHLRDAHAGAMEVLESNAQTLLIARREIQRLRSLIKLAGGRA